MVNYTPRAPEKFTNSDSSATYTFPVDELEWEPKQSFRVATAGVIGADYGHDFAQGAPWAKDFGEEGVRFSLWGSDQEIDDAFDACVGGLINIGAGKLWAVDAAGSRRWCWAKLAGLPEKTVDAEQLYKLPVAVRFVRESDWFSESAVTVTRAGVVVSPDEFTVTNPGNAPCRAITCRLKSNGVSGFDLTEMLNVSNGYQWSTTRTAADADSEVKVVVDEAAALYSANNGATYADDYANFDFGDAQIAFMQFEAGDNLIRLTDNDPTPDFDFVITFYPTWHSA